MVSTPQPSDADPGFVERHRTMDQRLEDAFSRYRDAYEHEGTGTPVLSRARLDLTLLLWPDQELPPLDVQRQLVRDSDMLLASTPPLD